VGGNGGISTNSTQGTQGMPTAVQTRPVAKGKTFTVISASGRDRPKKNYVKHSAPTLMGKILEALFFFFFFFWSKGRRRVQQRPTFGQIDNVNRPESHCGAPKNRRCDLRRGKRTLMR